MADPPPNPRGHRRYASLEVSQLRALRDEIASGRPPPAAVHLLRAIEGRRVERFVTPLLDAASGHDADSVQRVLAELDREMDYERAVQAVIIPALRGVGDRWQAGSCDVLGEHLLTAAARRWISRGAEGLRPASGGRVFLSTAPFENHTVALEAFAFSCRAGDGVASCPPRSDGTSIWSMRHGSANRTSW